MFSAGNGQKGSRGALWSRWSALPPPASAFVPAPIYAAHYASVSHIPKTYGKLTAHPCACSLGNGRWCISSFKSGGFRKKRTIACSSHVHFHAITSRGTAACRFLIQIPCRSRDCKDGHWRPFCNSSPRWNHRADGFALDLVVCVAYLHQQCNLTVLLSQDRCCHVLWNSRERKAKTLTESALPPFGDLGLHDWNHFVWNWWRCSDSIVFQCNRESFLVIHSLRFSPYSSSRDRFCLSQWDADVKRRSMKRN